MNFDYDSENDDLFIYSSKNKSKGSIELNNLILDLDTNKNVVGMEIIGASTFLKNISKEITKKKLSLIKKCYLDIKTDKNFIFITTHLEFDGETSTMPFVIPNIQEVSPAVV